MIHILVHFNESEFVNRWCVRDNEDIFLFPFFKARKKLSIEIYSDRKQFS